MLKGIMAFALPLLIASTVPTFAATGSYPEKTVTIVAPFSPGAADTVARVLAQHMGEVLEESVIVENRPGASGAIGVGYVKRAKPDGYTLLFATASQMSINPQLRSVRYDPLHDFTEIAPVGEAPYVIAINASLGVNSLHELIKYGKSNPKPIKMGNAGVGSLSAEAAVLFGQHTGLNVLTVPFKGTHPAAVSMQSGETDAMVATYVSFIGGVDAGKAKVLAVASQYPLEAAPHIPTTKEAGLDGFEVGQWWGLYGPRGIPKSIVKTLNTAVNEALKSTQVQKQLSSLGARPLGGSPADLTTRLNEEYERWGKVIRAQKKSEK